MYRHLALYRRSWPRLLELAYWPTLQMCIWGFTASFFAARLGNAGATTIGVLLGGVLLWEVALRSQMGVAISFLEEIWSRNLGHVFVSPLRPWELVAALIAMSILRMAMGVLPAVLLAWVLYAFNLFAMGPVLVLFVVNLMTDGLVRCRSAVVSLILRHGAGAEALAWSVLFGLTPFSAVFYPVSVLPAVAQPIALALPSAHVFEGMRAALNTGTLAWDHLAWAFGLNLVWMARRRPAVRPAIPRGPRARRPAVDRRIMMSQTRFLADPPRAGGGERPRHPVRHHGRGIVPAHPGSADADVRRARPASAAAGGLGGDAAVAHPAHRRGDLARRLPRRAVHAVEPDLIEQDLGEWQGLPHAELPPRLSMPAHPFWPLAGTESPPGGESMVDGDRPRRRDAGAAGGQPRGRGCDCGQPWRRDPRRGGARAGRRRGQRAASVGRQSVADPLERHPGGWRVVCVNEMADLSAT